jgi:hypothetical protein
MRGTNILLHFWLGGNKTRAEIGNIEHNVFKGVGAKNQIIKFIKTDFMFLLQPPQNKEVISFLSQKK